MNTSDPSPHQDVQSDHVPKPWEHAKSGEGSGADPLATGFVESVSYDRRLYKQDIAGSIRPCQDASPCGAPERA